MSLEQVTRPPAYQILAEELRAQITTGRLRPGERLPTEPQLCARSGLSRSTVREALRLLASQHLIVTTRGVAGGSFVAHPTPDQLGETLATGVRLLFSTARFADVEVFEVRELVEVQAAGLAAKRRCANDLAVLRDILAREIAAEPATRLAAHRAFHSAIAAATGNPVFELVARPLYQVHGDHVIARGAGEEFWTQVHADHGGLLGRLEAEDPIGAAEVMRAHLRFLQQHHAPGGPA